MVGWGAFDKDSVKGQLKFFEYEPKKWDEDDIDSELDALSHFELI